MSVETSRLSYVVITPARNEAAHIGRLLAVMTAQTHRPRKWIIVDDHSTDATADLVRAYLPDHPWIELVERSDVRDRSFAASG